MRHGPHHAAQKSTNTGLSDCMTSASQFESLTSATNLLISISLKVITVYSKSITTPFQYPVFRPRIISDASVRWHTEGDGATGRRGDGARRIFIFPHISFSPSRPVAL